MNVLHHQLVRLDHHSDRLQIRLNHRKALRTARHLGAQLDRFQLVPRALLRTDVRLKRLEELFGCFGQVIVALLLVEGILREGRCQL